MTNFHFNRWLAVAASASLWCCVGLAQQGSGEPSLGDAARAHQKSSQQGKPAPKIYTNVEVVATASAQEAKAVSSVPGDPGATQESLSTLANSKHRVTENSSKTSILDRTKDTGPDEITIPAGTEIRVDVEERKVVNPVRVGFSTPIPALSNVAVRMERNYVPYDNAVSSQSYSNYVDYATLTAVTIGDSTYAVQANPQPLLKGATNREVIFVLNAPLAIPR